MKPAIFILALTLAACANAASTKITAADFSPHGKFKPTTPKVRSYFECRSRAIDTGQKLSPHARGIAGAIALRRAVATNLVVCMEAKGYRYNGTIATLTDKLA